jgi:RNA polymerase sigma-70 factor (ECF subfamily)
VDIPCERLDRDPYRAGLLDPSMNLPAGTRQAQAEEVQALFLAQASQIRGFIGALVPDCHRANDIFQDVFLTTSRLADRFERGSNFNAWVRAIARNKVLQEQSRCAKMRHSHLPLDETLLECLEPDFEEVEETWVQRKAALAKCLEQVAPKARQIVDLRFEQDVPPQKIALTLGWTVNAVRVALSRARRLLFECVERRLANHGN